MHLILLLYICIHKNFEVISTHTNCSFLFEGKSAVWDELFKKRSDLGVGLGSKLSLVSDCVQKVLVLGTKMSKVHLFEFTNIGGLNLIEVTLDTSVKDANLLLSGHWNVLLLLEELSEFLTSVKKLLSRGIKIGTELGESSDFSVLGKLELHGTGNLLHGLDLGGGTDSRYGKTDVNCWSDTSIEELSL